MCSAAGSVPNRAARVDSDSDRSPRGGYHAAAATAAASAAEDTSLTWIPVTPASSSAPHSPSRDGGTRASTATSRDEHARAMPSTSATASGECSMSATTKS